jgi:hypothetical protein
MDRGKISCTCRELNPDSSVIKPISQSLYRLDRSMLDGTAYTLKATISHFYVGEEIIKMKSTVCMLCNYNLA